MYPKVMRFRDLQNKSIDFDFVFIGENFVYVLLFVLYQRRYHAVTDMKRTFENYFGLKRIFLDF